MLLEIEQPEVVFVVDKYLRVAFAPARESVSIGFIGCVMVFIGKSHGNISVEHPGMAHLDIMRVPITVATVKPNDVFSLGRQNRSPMEIRFDQLTLAGP